MKGSGIFAFKYFIFFSQKFYWKRPSTYEIKLALIAQKAVVLWFQGQTASDFAALNEAYIFHRALSQRVPLCWTLSWDSMKTDKFVWN